MLHNIAVQQQPGQGKINVEAAADGVGLCPTGVTTETIADAFMMLNSSPSTFRDQQPSKSTSSYIQFAVSI